MASDKDLETIKKELAYIKTMMRRESLEYSEMDPIWHAAENARTALESHELSLLPEVEEVALAA